MAEVRLSVRAEIDAASIALEIAGGDAAAGQRFYRRLDEFLEVLANFPSVGRPRSDLGDGVRLFVLDRRWLILYRVRADAVTVERIYARGSDFPHL